ncbi:protein mono-ADP-ribosyltransferase PARP12b, partial [Kryptolebias marmoratus]|uniref:protein mono-ADP-ribosyltransferase PARP12b n=1 Tax=Kryptolebias marmoratus TaxID=37003 RepID=UPI0018AD04E0
LCQNWSCNNKRQLKRSVFISSESNVDLLSVLLQVCLHYNKGSGPHGACSFQKNCSKVHLCQHFVQGGCRFGHACKRLHAIEPHAQRMLEERGLSGDIIRDLPLIYRNLHLLTAPPAPPAPPAAPPAPPAAPAPETETDSIIKAAQRDEMKEICLHFLRNSCRFLQNCRQVHFHLPYKWEVLVADTWTDLLNMEDIERDYCEPSKSLSSNSQPVNFVTMTWESLPVRRLSTVSSVTKPPHYSLTTRWLWYYKGDRGNWVEYGQLDDKQRSTSVTSQTLEEAYLSDKTAEVKVLKGQREYLVCFKDMYQRNPKHKTRRRICCRPRFVSRAEVDKHVAAHRKCSG